MKKNKVLTRLRRLPIDKQVKVALIVAEMVLPTFEAFCPVRKEPRRAVEEGKKADAAANAADAAYVADAAAYAANAITSVLQVGVEPKIILEIIEEGEK